MDRSDHYRAVAARLSNHLDNLIDDVDPVIYQTTLGRHLIAETLVNKAVTILIEEAEPSNTYNFLLTAINDVLSKETDFRKNVDLKR